MMTTTIPNDEEMLTKLDSGFNALDTLRTNGLIRLKEINATQTTMLEKERARLGTKYTDKHPRVRKITERLSYNQGLAAELSREIEKSTIEVPQTDANTWLAHGRVMKADGTALSGLTVSLYDDTDKEVAKIGQSSTNAQGYFALVYKIAESDTTSLADSQTLYLTIVNTNHQRIYQASEPLYARFGSIDYRLIVIKEPVQDDGSEDIGKIYPDAWVACGEVFDIDGKPAQGLMVTLYDKDFLFDDVLGTVVTDENGVFKIIYRTEAFRKLFEEKPDLYLKISDSKGNLVYSSEDSVRPNANHLERFRILTSSPP